MRKNRGLVIASIRTYRLGEGPLRATLLLLSVLGANAQDSIAPRPAEVRDAEILERYERQAAKAFETIRRENNLPKLSRIAHRQQLDQLVCTAALNDANPSGQNFPAALMYKTSDPASVTEELKSIAQYDQVETPPDSRYALAVWPGTDKKTGQRVYWVGVEIYTSAFYEFIDNNFTDNRPDRNQWKRMVAQPCRDVR
jgi:hypothetical protein